MTHATQINFIVDLQLFAHPHRA